MSAAALLAGCAQPAIEQHASDERLMRCVDGPTATFHFPDPESLSLTIHGDKHRLERQRTASGDRYSGRGIDFWNKGDAVMLTLDGQRFSCTID